MKISHLLDIFNLNIFSIKFIVQIKLRVQNLIFVEILNSNHVYITAFDLTLTNTLHLSLLLSCLYKKIFSSNYFYFFYFFCFIIFRKNAFIFNWVRSSTLIKWLILTIKQTKWCKLGPWKIWRYKLRDRINDFLLFCHAKIP